MSSHREAPEISKDPVADSSDLYAFVSPDKPGYATIIANYVPSQAPDGGPNFFEFGDDVLYEIHISNRGDAQADITYGFRFHTVVFNKKTFLYNTGQITSVFDPHFNRRQYYSVTRTTRGGKTVQLGANLTVPPCNIGPRSTPNYEHLAAQCVHGIGNRTFFAGQRADAFHVDLGAVFDLLDLRPFQELHVIPTAAATGVNSLAGANVHSIAMRVPLSDLTVDGKTPTDPASLKSVVGIWTTASRQRTHLYEGPGATAQNFGSWEQVSRLGNPLINEVVIPMGSKDDWNHSKPSNDSDYAASFLHPEVAGLLPVLYPGVFKNLAAVHQAARRPGRDLGYRYPVGHHPRLPELHRQDGRRHAAPEPGDPGHAVRQGQPGRSCGWRPGRIPERSPGDRRRGHDRVAGDRGSADPARRQVVQAGRGDKPGRRRHDRDADAASVPVPQHAARRIQRGLA